VVKLEYKADMAVAEGRQLLPLSVGYFFTLEGYFSLAGFVQGAQDMQ